MQPHDPARYLENACWTWRCQICCDHQSTLFTRTKKVPPQKSADDQWSAQLSWASFRQLSDLSLPPVFATMWEDICTTTSGATYERPTDEWARNLGSGGMSEEVFRCGPSAWLLEHPAHCSDADIHAVVDTADAAA